MKAILITGAAGFIGSTLADMLLGRGYKVIAVDNFDDFYDPEIKRKNISEALTHPNYSFISSDICSLEHLEKHLHQDISAIIHLAAKAGVRSSILNPGGYEHYNTDSITKALELALRMNIKKFIFTSSSSIYGNSGELPFRETQQDLLPLNPYAISKLKSEHIGKIFAERNNISFISLRLFSVYGPRLRPDLLMTKIAQSLNTGTPLKIFGNGSVKRDFTHVNDVVEGIISSLNYPAGNFEIFNIGYGSPVSVTEIIRLFENISGEKISMHFINAINGESVTTWADKNKATSLLNFRPQITLAEGIMNFLKWYVDFHGVRLKKHEF